MATKYLFQGFLEVAPLTYKMIHHKNKNGGYELNSRGRNYETMILWELLRYKEEISTIRKMFDSKKHCLRVSFVFCLENMLNKRGMFSKTAGDTDNFIKKLNDIIHDQLNIDDCYTHVVKAMKAGHHEPGIAFRIRVMDKEDDIVNREDPLRYLDFLEGPL